MVSNLAIGSLYSISTNNFLNASELDQNNTLIYYFDLSIRNTETNQIIDELRIDELFLLIDFTDRAIKIVKKSFDNFIFGYLSILDVESSINYKDICQGYLVNQTKISQPRS